jgi:hypothetical protein
MNNTEAKFILSAYRPDGSDAADATFCAALAQAKTDPALARWFELEQAFDRTLCAKLGEVASPKGLREAILAGARVSGEPATTTRAWWRQPVWLAAAAGVALFFALGVTFWPARAQATDFTDFLIDDARRSDTHGGEGGHNDALQAKFTEPGTRLGGKVALDFATLRDTGCRTIKFQGQDVLEVCFKRNGVWFHCYVVRKADFPALVAAATPVISEHGKVYLAKWADEEHVFMVFSKISREALEKLV